MKMKKRYLVAVMLTVAIPIPLALAEGFIEPGGLAPEKAGLITDKSFYKVIVGNEGLTNGSPPLGFGSYTLIHGPSVESNTHYLVVPKARAASGKAKARITSFEVTFQQIVGPPGDLRRGLPDIYRGVIDYRADRVNPPISGNHNSAIITPAEVARVLVNWWILRETIQFVQCGVWNHTIGLGTGVFCFNVPWWKGLEDELEFETELKLVSPQPRPYRGWLLLPIEPANLVSIHWLVEIEAWPKGQPSQRQTYALIGDIEFDADGDGWPNGTEIDRGTNPFDPNSRPMNLISVPSVIGQTDNQAQVTLQNVGLLLGLINYEYSAVQPVGRVSRQLPAATSQVLPGSAVHIWLSLGPEPPQTATVPSIFDKTPAQADGILEGTGLDLHPGPFAEDFHPTVAAGRFISQTPVAGAQVPLGTVVTGTLSKGPQPPPPSALTVAIDSPANNFVGVVGQPISFACTVSGGIGPYSFKWHFPDSDFRYLEDVVKTFDIPGAGWVYLEVTDSLGTTVQKKIWIQINP